MAVISTGVAAEWDVFTHQTEDGRPVVVRSRVAKPEVRQFATTNLMARLRCVLGPSQVNEHGMPLSTEALDEWEGKLLQEIEQADTETYEIAVVTGAGVRDFFFTAREEKDLISAVENVTGSFPFELQVARVDGPREGLLNSLTRQD
jgi:hypothetical protein